MEDIGLSIAAATYTGISSPRRIGRGAVQRYVEANYIINLALNLI